MDRKMRDEEFAYSMEKLELREVLGLIASFAMSEEAKERILSVQFLDSIEDIERSQREIAEVAALIERGDAFPLGGWWNSLGILRHLSAEGMVLSEEDLFRVAAAEGLAGTVKRFVLRMKDELPLTSRYAQRIDVLEDVVDSIERAIGDDFKVKDAASPRLKRVRKEIQTLRNKLRESFSNFVLRLSDNRGVEFVTLRGERYVISVPRTVASRIKGVVHQASASGASLYIEPMEFVEENNRLEELIGEEADEVEAILRGLTGIVYESRQVLIRNQEVLVELDELHSKARFAVEYSCTTPVHADDGRLVLRGARHPLLERLLRKRADGGGVVPLDLDCSSKLRAVVISGPNAGGKTVALKTIGLVVLMDRIGLTVPCRNDSIIPDFSGVLVDIGDDQSIEESLSTFSSKVERLKRIMQSLDERSLVLIDELGGGTDPEEGAALAEAFLEEVAPRVSKVFVSTHLSALKAWAHGAEIAENATMEFDADGLRPLYRFKLGVPGRSWGLDMAWRLGLQRSIVESARGKLDEEHLKLEDLIAHLEKTETLLEKEYRAIKEKEETLSELVRHYRERLDEFKRQRGDLMEEARKEALEIVSRTRRDMERLIKEIRSSRAEKSAIKKARSSVDRLSESLVKKAPRDGAERLSLDDISEGMHLAVKSLGRTGRVTHIDEKGRVFLELDGGLRVETSVDDLRKPQEEIVRKGRSRPVWSVDVSGEVSDTLSVRGMEKADALELVDRFIDRAVLHGLNRVVIIHGKGRGILRRAIYDMLKKDSRVNDIHPGEPARGGDGFAIVELK